MERMATKWKKDKILGRGSYGTVYLASPVDSSAASSDRLVAVKSADFHNSSTLKKEGIFLDELRGYPNIIKCFGDDISIENDQGEVYNLLLEYAPGGTLLDLIVMNRGTISESQVALYTFMLLRALSFIHEEEIVHCDLKPDNVLVFLNCQDSLNQLKIADFGLSKKVREPELSKNRGLGYNHRGATMYASPESVASGLHETACDIWSLGCIIVEMITGDKIWTYQDSRDLLSKIMFEKPKIPENMSEVGKDFLRRCLEREIQKRWTAEMLLNHPFIVKNMEIFYGTYPPCDCGQVSSSKINPIGYVQWSSTIELFATSSSLNSQRSPSDASPKKDQHWLKELALIDLFSSIEL